MRSSRRNASSRRVGLTGGVATGKSTVTALLKERGAAVIDADSVAREVVAPGTPAHQEIVTSFGRGITDASGALDRKALAEVIFGDAQRRRELEAITHPRILSVMRERLEQATLRDVPLVVADVPLLFEIGAHQLNIDGDEDGDDVLLVYAPRELQLRRLMMRDGIDRIAAAARVDAQLPIEEKRGKARWVLDNSGPLEETRAQLDCWWREVVEQRH